MSTVQDGFSHMLSRHTPGSPSVTAHAHLAAPLVSWCGVLGVTALGGAVTKCRGVHPVSLPGAAVDPRCHDMEWLRALVVPQCHGLGGFGPWCHRVSMGHCPPGSRCGVALSPLSRHVPTATAHPGHVWPGTPAFSPRAGSPALPVPAVLRTERQRMLALSLPPFLPGRYRGWARAWTGDGVGALPGPVRRRPGRVGPRRTEPNRVKRSRNERIPLEPNRDELSRERPKEPERAAPNQAGSNRAGPNLPEPPRAQPSRAELGPSVAEPSRSCPS